MFHRLIPVALAATFLTACDNDPANAPAMLRATPTSVDFGRGNPNSGPIVRSITIENAGGSRGPVLSASLSGAGKAGFAVLPGGSTCIGRRLAAGESCTVAVALGGLASGPVSATLRVGGGDEEAQTTVALTGVLESLLNVYYQGVGHGTISVSGQNLSCDQVCTLVLDVPTVTLTAQPDPQSTFVGWIGVPGCGTSASCVLPLIDLNAVTVRFDPQ